LATHTLLSFVLIVTYYNYRVKKLEVGGNVTLVAILMADLVVNSDIMMYLLTAIGLTHPVAIVQYTFTHKQYTEQHNETEYLERNIHNNKNTNTNKRIHNITKRIHNSKNIQFTKLNRSIQPYIYIYKIELKEYDKI
jgi:cell division protein FtsL